MLRNRAMLPWLLGVWAMALWLVAAAASAPEVAAVRNLCRNPGFELDKNQDGMPDDWESVELHAHRTSQCKHDRQISYAGDCSAMITQGSLYATITGTAGWIQRRMVERGGGKTLRMSVYVRAGEPEQVNRYVKTIFPTRVRLYLFGEDRKTGSDYSGAASPVFEIGPEWQKISHTNTFPRNITAVSLILAREAQVGGGHVWFDNVEVVEVKE